MSNTPHELADEFPDQVDAIHALKTTNAHFAKLVDDSSVREIMTAPARSPLSGFFVGGI